MFIFFLSCLKSLSFTAIFQLSEHEMFLILENITGNSFNYSMIQKSVFYETIKVCGNEKINPSKT